MLNIEHIIELQQAKGINAKQLVLKKYSKNNEFKMLLYYALNPTITYNLSEASLAKEDKEVKPDILWFDSFLNCCEYLSRLKAMDDFTCKQVRLFLNTFPSNQKEVLTKLLSKTLRLGVTAKTVNKIIPNLIPEWEVQQAYPIDKYPLNDSTEFWATQKLNGVRATFYKGQLIARSGVAFKGLEHITNEIMFTSNDLVLDGELTIKNKDGLSDNEAFRKTTGILNSDDINKTSICFTVFDAVTIEGFEKGTSNLTYRTRRQIMDSLSNALDNARSVTILPLLYHGNDTSKIDKLLEQMVKEDKEGLIINLDVPYKRTRHSGILKVKRFYTMDLQITGYNEGTGRLGGSLGSLVVLYKGNEVCVGSGFSDEQRKVLWESRESLIGTLCEVKYKEISQDKNTGLSSLQFPVFIRLRYDKLEESYG